MGEREVQHDIRAALGRDPRVALWRNNVGTMKVETCPHCRAPLRSEEIKSRNCSECGRAFQKPERRFVQFGLVAGSSDLLGILRPSGRFIALEVKTPEGRTSIEQEWFLSLIQAAGGFACVVRSVSDAVAAIDRASQGATQ